jgi:hypothetical protein
MQAIDDVRPHVDGNLVELVRQKYPIPTGGLKTPGAVIDWALRKLLEV